MRILFIDYSSAFNTIVPFKLVTKLRTLNTSLCNWILDILTGHPQAVRVGYITSATLTLNIGAPVLRISVADVLLPSLTTWGRPIRKSRIQLQRELFSPRVLSLVISFEGAMVLNAEL